MVKRFRDVSIRGLLLMSLIGLLIAYLLVVNDLPSQILSVAQQEYLSYNVRRTISQLAPTWNIVDAVGQVGPTLLPGQESHVRVTLDARYEEQDGVSVTVYDLDFRGVYHLVHNGPVNSEVELFFPFPGNLETLHGVYFEVDGEEPPEVNYATDGMRWRTTLQPGQEHQIVIGYRADGVNSFSYGLHHNQRCDVDITVTVAGLTGSHVPRNSLPPTASEVNDGREIFTWKYSGLIAERDIQLALPTRLSFAQRLAQFQDDFRALARLAPFLVGLFLASLAGVFHLSGMSLRTESYLLAGLGLALFYPILTFLSGVVGVILASLLALILVSGILLVFLSLTAGWRGTWWRVGSLLLIFLVIFSLGWLTPWRGLAASGGGLLLVGIFMVLYARRPAPPEPEPDPQSTQVSHEPEYVPVLEEVIPEAEDLHCPDCGRALADDYQFCPGCGHNTSPLQSCADCGYKQLVPADSKPVYCIHCGRLLQKLDITNIERRDTNA
jgi:hypothetical protein